MALLNLLCTSNRHFDKSYQPASPRFPETPTFLEGEEIERWTQSLSNKHTKAELIDSSYTALLYFFD